MPQGLYWSVRRQMKILKQIFSYFFVTVLQQNELTKIALLQSQNQNFKVEEMQCPAEVSLDGDGSPRLVEKHIPRFLELVNFFHLFRFSNKSQ